MKFLISAIALFLVPGFTSSCFGALAHASTTETNPAVLTIETGLPVTSLAAVPATAHRGLSHILVAHGDGGFSAYDTTGRMVWRVDIPATLVAHYQNQLIVYRLKNGKTVLDRYQVTLPGLPVLAESHSPSPMAATTIQRSAIAALGPIRISDRSVITGKKTIDLEKPVSAVAGANYFSPIIGGKTIVIATDDGTITVRQADDY